MKAYGGNTFLHDSRQKRTIVIAKNKKEAVKLLEKAGEYQSYYHFNLYWSETHNNVEISFIDQGPGVWVNEDNVDYPKDIFSYKRYA